MAPCRTAGATFARGLSHTKRRGSGRRRRVPCNRDAGATMPQPCPTTSSAADFLPKRLTLPQLRSAARNCRGCHLYCHATQTVFGEGPARAAVMLIGEQPGDQEDRQGHPFVGPAGRLLDEVLEDVGIDRGRVYVTNAVKHFKFTQRGKRRLHAKPGARELSACRPWLEAEVQVVRPRAIVCLGATAAQALLGSSFRLTRHFGQVHQHEWTDWLIATLHPSAVLRAPDPQRRKEARQQFEHDLRMVAEYVAGEG